MCDPLDAAKDAVSDAVAKTLEKPVDNLLGPITKDVGLALGDVGSIFRFYVHDNLTKVFRRWAEQRHGTPIQPSDFKRVLALLQGASLQSNDELQERWAALLESTVTDAGTVLPSFGYTLSQLTAHEARYLDDLWKSVISPPPIRPNPSGHEHFDYLHMMRVFDPSLSRHITNHFQKTVLKHTLTQEQADAIEKQAKLDLMIQDFERLGIIGSNTDLKPGRSQVLVFGSKRVAVPGENPTLEEHTSFTPYGIYFIQAVTPKR